MQDIHPAKPPIEIPLLTETQKAILYVIIGVILILIIWRLWDWLSQKYFFQEKKKQTPAPHPPRNFEKEALDKLEKIQPLFQEHEFHQFYLEITAIVRQYFTDKHTINVLDMTTKEIKRSRPIRDTMGDKQHEFLVQFLNTVDTVKFAGTDTDVKAAEEVYQKVEQYLSS